MKLGILGGTFDPIHIGHLILGEAAWEELSLHRVLYMPAGNPPHKRHREGRASDLERVDMVRSAISGNPHFELSLLEMNPEGYTYTYRTLERMREAAPEDELYFIIGADSLKDFPTWREPGRICQACTLVVATRDGIETELLADRMEEVRERFHAQIVSLRTKPVEISSHEIREWVQEGRSIRYFVPEAVETYIREQGIYSPGSGLL